MSALRPGGESRTLIVVAVVSVIIAIIAFVTRPGPSGDGIDPRPRAEVATDPATAGSTEEPRRSEPEPSEPAASGAVTDPLGVPIRGLGAPDGIDGQGSTSSLPRHTLTLRLSTTGSLGNVAWIIPTSKQHRRGRTIVTGSSWSLTTTVYGNPDYGVLFGQAGPNGNRVTCTITIDGRVTDRRSTSGPYGAMWCQG